jgi:hypothetical protein
MVGSERGDAAAGAVNAPAMPKNTKVVARDKSPQLTTACIERQSLGLVGVHDQL